MEDLKVVIRRLEGAGDAQQAYCCMTEVPTPWPQALCQCREWISHNLGKYIEGYHLQLENGEVVGHLYYAPSNKALFPYVVEADIDVLYCEWVQRRYQGKGLGRNLFGRFLEDLNQSGSKGILVENTAIEGQDHLEQYLRRGFGVIYESGETRLLYLPLRQETVEVKPLEERIRPSRRVPVEILVIGGYMCPYEAATSVLLQEVVREFGDRVILRQEPLTPHTLEEFGVSRGIFINGRRGLAGAETEESIRQAIMEAL
jgi:GNAT superfamily N-acetyltransferase